MPSLSPKKFRRRKRPSVGRAAALGGGAAALGLVVAGRSRLKALFGGRSPADAPAPLEPPIPAAATATEPPAGSNDVVTVEAEEAPVEPAASDEVTVPPVEVVDEPPVDPDEPAADEVESAPVAGIDEPPVDEVALPTFEDELPPPLDPGLERVDDPPPTEDPLVLEEEEAAAAEARRVGSEGDGAP